MYRMNRVTRCLAFVRRNAWKFIAVPLVIFSVELTYDRILDWLQGPTEYRIYLVGALQDPTTMQIHDGFRDHWERSSQQLDGVPVTILARNDGDDLGEVERVANTIAQSEDILVVIGHGSSSNSKTALVEYMAQTPMIPVLLLTETNPDLMPRICDSSPDPCPVLRLAPTDEDQAKTAVEFALANGWKNFAVIRDSQNPVYSTYLSNEIVKEMHRSNGSVLLWTTDSSVSSPLYFERLELDCVFYVGDHHKALVLIRQIKQHYNRVGFQSPRFILSDSAADVELPRLGGDMLDGVYLTHPRSANEIGDPSVGFRALGRDTAWLLDRLLGRANEILSGESGISATLKRWLSIRSAESARQALAQSMAQYEFNPGSPSRKEYQFDRKGNLTGARFHVWVVNRERFDEVNYRPPQ